MLTLYHLPLCPYSRKVRLCLREKGLEAELATENVWERREAFLTLNPAGEVPVLIDEGAALAESQAICEYLEEAYPDPRRSLLGRDATTRAEVRRLSAWFDLKFGREVTDNLVGEKLNKRLMGRGYPDSGAIRAGRQNLHTHLAYIGYLAERRNWLGGGDLSLADLAAAAQISCVDYLGDVPWEEYPEAKAWYVRIKSRPAFRPLLADHIAGVPPPRHYADLDF